MLVATRHLDSQNIAMAYSPKTDIENSISRWIPLTGFALGGLMLVAMLSRQSIDPPDNSPAFGCYLSGNSPAIRIDEDGINVIGSSLPAVQFRLDWDDSGITIWPEKQLTLIETPQRSYFEFMDEPGTAWKFVDVIDGRVYPDLDETSLTIFQIRTSTNRIAAYAQTDEVNCRSRVLDR